MLLILLVRSLNLNVLFNLLIKKQIQKNKNTFIMVETLDI